MRTPIPIRLTKTFIRNIRNKNSGTLLVIGDPKSGYCHIDDPFELQLKDDDSYLRSSAKDAVKSALCYQFAVNKVTDQNIIDAVNDFGDAQIGYHNLSLWRHLTLALGVGLFSLPLSLLIANALIQALMLRNQTGELTKVSRKRRQEIVKYVRDTYTNASIKLEEIKLDSAVSDKLARPFSLWQRSYLDLAKSLSELGEVSDKDLSSLRYVSTLQSLSDQADKVAEGQKALSEDSEKLLDVFEDNKWTERKVSLESTQLDAKLWKKPTAVNVRRIKKKSWIKKVSIGLPPMFVAIGLIVGIAVGLVAAQIAGQQMVSQVTKVPFFAKAPDYISGATAQNFPAKKITLYKPTSVRIIDDGKIFKNPHALEAALKNLGFTKKTSITAVSLPDPRKAGEDAWGKNVHLSEDALYHLYPNIFSKDNKYSLAGSAPASKDNGIVFVFTPCDFYINGNCGMSRVKFYLGQWDHGSKSSDIDEHNRIVSQQLKIFSNSDKIAKNYPTGPSVKVDGFVWDSLVGLANADTNAYAQVKSKARNTIEPFSVGLMWTVIALLIIFVPIGFVVWLIRSRKQKKIYEDNMQRTIGALMMSDDPIKLELNQLATEYPRYKDFLLTREQNWDQAVVELSDLSGFGDDTRNLSDKDIHSLTRFMKLQLASLWRIRALLENDFEAWSKEISLVVNSSGSNTNSFPRLYEVCPGGLYDNDKDGCERLLAFEQSVKGSPMVRQVRLLSGDAISFNQAAKDMDAIGGIAAQEKLERIRSAGVLHGFTLFGSGLNVGTNDGLGAQLPSGSYKVLVSALVVMVLFVTFTMLTSDISSLAGSSDEVDASESVHPARVVVTDPKGILNVKTLEDKLKSEKFPLAINLMVTSADCDGGSDIPGDLGTEAFGTNSNYLAQGGDINPSSFTYTANQLGPRTVIICVDKGELSAFAGEPISLSDAFANLKQSYFGSPTDYLIKAFDDSDHPAISLQYDVVDGARNVP